MSENPSTLVGQVSPDGQLRWDGAQWVPIPRGTREPTPWTRPMQLVTAALLAIQAVYGVASTLLTVNRETFQKSFARAGTQVPQGMTEDQFINIILVTTYITVIVIAVVLGVGAVAAYFGWRWAFWALLVLLGLLSLLALIGIGGLTQSVGSAIGEVLSLGNLALFIWMLIGLIRFGPWAMRRLGPA